MSSRNEIDKQQRRIKFFLPVFIVATVLLLGGAVIVRMLELPKAWFWLAVSPGTIVFFGYLFLLIRGHFAWNRAFDAKRRQDSRAFAELGSMVDDLSAAQRSRIAERCLQGDNIHAVLAEVRQNQSPA